jgi:phosphatidylglycerophosphatase A
MARATVSPVVDTPGPETPAPHRTPGDRAVLVVATGLGSGYAPVAPGTAGSLVGLALAWALSCLPLWGYLAATLAVSLLGVAVSARAETLLGRKDPGAVVIDEVAGMLVTMAGLPATGPLLVAGFLLFRVLDILKPFPCRWAERNLPGGWGVMGDDLMAGVYGCFVLHLAHLALGPGAGLG